MIEWYMNPIRGNKQVNLNTLLKYTIVGTYVYKNV